MRNDISFALGEKVLIEVNSDVHVMVVSAVDVIKNTIRVYSRDLGWILMLQFDQHGVVFNPPKVKISKLI
jgi:hypothetical protein